MTETLDTASAVQSILFRIESIEGTQHLLLQGEAEAILGKLLPLFADPANAGLTEVYFSIDGKRSQAEIVEALKDTGFKTSQPTVSRRMALLVEHGLIEQVDLGKRGAIFQRKKVVDTVLRLSSHLRKAAKQAAKSK